MNAAEKNAVDRKRQTRKPAASKPAPAATPSDLPETAPETKPAKKTAPAKKKHGADLAALTNAELRAKLLATPTISDSRWIGNRGNPQRLPKESRTDFVNRVLGG